MFRGHRSEWAIDRASATGVGRTGFRFRPPGGSQRIVRLECLGRERALADVVHEWQNAPPPKGTVVLPPTVVVPEGRRLVSWPVAVGLLAIVALPAGFALIDPSLWIATLLFALVITALSRRGALRRSGAWNHARATTETVPPSVESCERTRIP